MVIMMCQPATASVCSDMYTAAVSIVDRDDEAIVTRFFLSRLPRTSRAVSKECRDEYKLCWSTGC